MNFDSMRLFLIILSPFLWWYSYFYVIRRIEDEGHSSCAYVSNTSNWRLCRPCHFFLLEMSQHGAIEARSLYRILTNTVFCSMIKENNEYLWDWGLNYFELYVVIKNYVFISWILRFTLWNIIIRISDWTNNVFSQSFTSNLWNESFS